MSILKTKTIGVFNKAEEVKETPVNMNKVQSVTNTNWITKETDFFTIKFDTCADDKDIFQAIMENKSNKVVHVLEDGVQYIVLDMTVSEEDQHVIFYIAPADEEADDYSLEWAFTVKDVQGMLEDSDAEYVSFSTQID